jgi:hypothetical protein
MCILKTHHLSWVFVVLVSITGCSNESKPLPTFKTSGVVKYNKQPLAGALVLLIANNGSKEVPKGTTNEQGEFQLTTYAMNDGAPEGNYQVKVVKEPQGLDDGADNVVRTSSLPTKYSSEKTSGISVVIKSESNQLTPFELSGPPIKK